MQREAADEHVDGGELPENAYARRIHANFLRCLAERGLGQCFSRIGCPTRKTDLTGVAREAACANRERDRGSRLVRVQQQQRSRLPRFGRQLARAPRLAEQLRGEAHLRFDAGKSSRQAVTERRLDLA